jgi:hypothetical protein
MNWRNTMANRNNHFNRPELSESTLIDLKGRKVGSEDLAQAGLMLKWCENQGYRGNSLRIASNVALGLEFAVQFSLQGNHEAAAKKAGNVMYVLNKDRVNSKAGNYRALGSIRIECRDGQVRAIGEIVEWYMSVHMRINEQILKARANEKAQLEAAELEALQFAMSVADGKAAQAETTVKTKAA